MAVEAVRPYIESPSYTERKQKKISRHLDVCSVVVSNLGVQLTFASSKRAASTDAPANRFSLLFPVTNVHGSDGASKPLGPIGVARTTSTEQGPVRTTFSVTEPNAKRRQPVYPCVEITIKSACSLSAVRVISNAASFAKTTVLRACTPACCTVSARSPNRSLAVSSNSNS